MKYLETRADIKHTNKYMHQINFKYTRKMFVASCIYTYSYISNRVSILHRRTQITYPVLEFVYYIYSNVNK